MMTYLSEISLNPLRRGAQELLSSRQRLHAAVEASLPPERSGEGRVLWRLEDRPHKVALLVQTPDRPTFDHIVEQAGWRDNVHAAPRIADLQPVLAQVAKGRRFAFRVVVNPVSVSRSVEAPTSAQQTRLAAGGAVRVSERTAAFQTKWFLDRTIHREQWGFRVLTDDGVPQVTLGARETVRFGRAGSTVTLTLATFDGALEVTDTDEFAHSLLHGIGKAKAYGAGLITLAPLAS